MKVLRTLLALLLFLPSLASAAGSYEVYNLPTMYLNVGVNSTQTVDISVAPPVKNGATLTIPNMSGAILELRQGSRTELIYSSQLTVNQSTKVITLGGTVIRDVCYNVARTITGCSDGQIFSKGAEVRLTNAAQLYNLKANIDRANTFYGLQSFGSGVDIIGTDRPLKLSSYTTTQRDTLTPETGFQIINTTTGTEQTYYGGTWNDAGTSTTANATESAAGKVELGTVADQLAKTSTGDSGPTVVRTLYLTSSGAAHGTDGSTNASRIPILNSNGALPASVGGLGRINYSSGSLLLGAGSGAAMLLRPGTVNQVVLSDGTRWSAGTIPNTVAIVLNNATAGTATGTSVTSKSYFKEHTYTVTGSTLVNGVSYAFDGMFAYTYNSGNFQFEVSLGNTTLASCSITPTGASDGTIEGRLWGTAAAGASVAVRARIKVSAQNGAKLCEGYSTAGVNIGTNADRKLQFSFTPSASSPSNSATLSTLTVIRNTYP